MHYEHIPFEYTYGKALRRFDYTDFGYVELAKHRNKGAPKILFVLDYTPKESLGCGMLLKGPTGELLSNIIKLAEDYYGAQPIAERDWLAISYHSVKTQGTSDAFKELAHAEFKQRLNYVIATYKPEVVVTFGPDPYKALNSEFLSKYQGKDGAQYQHFYGVPIDTTVVNKGISHNFKHIPTLSLHSLLSGDDKGGSMSLIGYVARNLTNALNRGKLVYEIPKLKYKIEVVDDLEKFKKMLADIKSAKVVAIDSETKNLYKRKNQTLTWQFSTRPDLAYILPLYHKDSPFMPDELAYIKKKLRIYFERDNKNQVHIYANAGFDLTCARRDLGVRYFKNNLWDVFAAEFSHDENAKFLQSVTGKNYYSLLNITMQYGCTAYYESEFGKEKRATIVDQDLDGPVLTYMALDVIVLHHIRKLQIQRGKDTGYEKYISVVSEQLSDQIHVLSNLEFNGSYIDIDWLFKLKSRDSPIVAERSRIIKALYETKGVKKANQRLIKESGAPAVGLFGRSDLKLFNIRKEDHKQLLFFDILKLAPIFLKKNGQGKIDKEFQAKYSDIEEVKLYNELTKVNKLYNAYVKSFIRQWADDADMRGDSRIRPRFGYLDVVTGRTSAKKPSLQQIPSRSELGKLIKRLFIAELGRLIIKVDFCVAGDALIPTENGLIRLDSIPHNPDGTMNLKMSSLESKANTSVRWMYMGEKPVLTLKTSSGNEITCTPDHKLYVLRDGYYEWIEAQHCKDGDYLCLPKTKMVRSKALELTLSAAAVQNANNSTGHNNVYKTDKCDTYHIKIKNGGCYYTEYGFATIDSAVAARDQYCLANNIPTNSRSFVNITKPTHMTPDLAYLLGAIVAEGWYTAHNKHNHVFFTNSDRKYVERVAECFGNVFGKTPTIEHRKIAGMKCQINGVDTQANKDMWEIRVRNNSIAKWMDELGVYTQHGYKDGKTRACYQVVPWSVLQADEESQLAFLAAMIEGDGYVKNGVSLQIDSASKELISGMRAILNSHGFITGHRERHGLSTNKHGVESSIYGVTLGRRSSQDLFSRLGKYMVTKQLPLNCDVNDRIGTYEGKRLKHYHVTKIKSITDAGVKPVYDLTMKDQSRACFAANGILVHNCAHEIRGWSIISGDKEVANTFKIGFDLRNKFKLKPSAELATEIEFKGDVHKINAAYFFRMDIEKVDKPKRNSVKQVIFGLIYQQSAKGTAKSINATVEEVDSLTAKFFKRFPVGAGWFDKIKAKARKNLFVESPLGRRRHLWGLLVPKSHEQHDPIFARNERQSVNSPVQGMGSDFMMIGARAIERLRYEHYENTGHYPDFYQANSVHDSLEFSCAYEDFWIAVSIIERGLTTEVSRIVKERHDFTLVSDCEIDLEIGWEQSTVEGWHGALTGKYPIKDKDSLDTILEMTLKGQKEVLGYDIDIPKTLKLIHSNFEYAPEWTKKQRGWWLKQGIDPLAVKESKPKAKPKSKKAA